MGKDNGITRRDFIKTASTLTVLGGAALLGEGCRTDTASKHNTSEKVSKSSQSANRKPRHRFSLDPFGVQKEGYIIYNYGTHENTTPKAGIEGWYHLKGHNFAGCRDYPIKNKKNLTRVEVKKWWEELKVVPVYMSGADPKAGVENVRKQWDEAVKQGYRVLSIDEFYPSPRTPSAYDKELMKFKEAHPDMFIQVWEANFPAEYTPFPHLETLMPFIDSYMPEVYWKWFKSDGKRRRLFQSLITRAKGMGALKKLVMGLGTHDVPHLEKTLEDIPAILDMEPNIGGFAFFVHIGGMDEEYNDLYAKLDELLRSLFATAY